MAAVIMAGVAWAAMSGMESLLPGRSLAVQISRLAVSMSLAVVALGLGAQLLRIREFEDVRDAVTTRLRRLLGTTER